MRLTPAILPVVLLAFAGDGLLAQDYLTKNGQLAKQLKVVQLQGGFAGFTGVQYTIAPDGSWTSESVFNQKLSPKHKGNLTEKDLAKLAALLEKYDLAKLPGKSGKELGANPHTITLEFGDKKASLVGQVPPKLDPKNPTDTVESRFAGIWEGVVGLLTVDKAEDEAIKGDRKQIEGTWRGVALVVDGKKFTDDDAKALTVVNAADGTWTLLDNGREVGRGTSTIDPTKKPRAIDFTPTTGPNKGVQYLGIYEPGEKTRRLCFSSTGKERPKDFTSTPGSGRVLVTFEREKAK